MVDRLVVQLQDLVSALRPSKDPDVKNEIKTAKHCIQDADKLKQVWKPRHWFEQSTLYFAYANLSSLSTCFAVCLWQHPNRSIVLIRTTLYNKRLNRCKSHTCTNLLFATEFGDQLLKQRRLTVSSAAFSLSKANIQFCIVLFRFISFQVWVLILRVKGLRVSLFTTTTSPTSPTSWT